MSADDSALARIRERIDRVDAELHKLLNERAGLALEVGKVKQAEQGGEAPVYYRPEREAQILARLKERNQGPLSDGDIARLFREVISCCLSLEQPLTVAYLGPPGTYTEMAALAQFGWRKDEGTERWVPKAPWEISGRGADGKPLKDPSHAHAFWLPEDADGDGWIDYVSVFIPGGMNDRVRAVLDRITRLWLAPKQRSEDLEAEPGSVKEWRLALEGFGTPADFAGGARIFARSRRWQSVTPFLASGHLKASGYPGEVRRLLKRRGLETTDVQVGELETIAVGGTERRAIHFHRFRSRGREVQPDAAGAMLSIVLPDVMEGPLAIGYGSHFGLGLFVPVRADAL